MTSNPDLSIANMSIYGCQRLVYNINIKNFKFYWESFPSKKDFLKKYFFFLNGVTNLLLLLLTMEKSLRRAAGGGLPYWGFSLGC